MGWRKWHRKLNQNQKRFAVASALAASAIPALVMARGHAIGNVAEVPCVVSDDIQNIQKTKDAIACLKAVGAFADVEKSVASKKLRAGKGKLRGRRHVQRLGPLIIYAEDNGITQAFRNLSGVELSGVDSLNLLQLAPGGHLGRFIIWTQSAFAKLADIWGSTTRESTAKSGYKLPMPMMTNSDLTRIINSDEVQSKVRPAIKDIKYAQRKKNPFKNFGAMVKLNPYALTARRSELLAAERRAANKAKVVNAARRKANKAHRATKAANFARISRD